MKFDDYKNMFFVLTLALLVGISLWGMNSLLKNFQVTLTGAANAFQDAITTITTAPGNTIKNVGEGVGQGVNALMEGLRKAFYFEPILIHNNKVMDIKSGRIFELATLQLMLNDKYEWKSSWLGSEKVVMIDSTYTIKFGINLDDLFTVQVDDPQKAITVTTSYPKMLSMETNDLQILSENGFWNGVKDEERSLAIKEAKNQAIHVVDSDAYKLLAYENFKTRFNQIAHTLGYQVEYRIHKPEDKL